jgi:chromosome segregation ATPase
MSGLDKYLQDVQRVLRHASRVAAMYKRYNNLATDIQRQMQMLTNLIDRTNELITTITSYCERLTSDTHSVKQSYVTHKQAIEQIKNQHRRSRALLTSLSEILHQIQQDAHFFLSSAQTLSRLAKNTEVKAHHARKEGKGLAVIAQECLVLANEARIPFTTFYQHVQSLKEIAEPIAAELVSMISLSRSSEGLLSHAFSSLGNLDRSAAVLKEITVRLEKHAALGDFLRKSVAEQLVLLDAHVSPSTRRASDMMARCKQLGVLTQRLRGATTAVRVATNDRESNMPRMSHGEHVSLLDDWITLLDQLTGDTGSPLIDDRNLSTNSRKIDKRVNELSVSATDLIARKNDLERGTSDIVQLRTNIEQFLTETHATSHHILECTSRLDKEIRTIEEMMQQTRSIFAKIKTLSVYAKIEEGRSQQYTGILAPVVHEYAQLEQQTAQTYSRLMPQIVNVKMHIQRLRAEQKIPSLEIIRHPDYAQTKQYLDDIMRITGEKRRLLEDITKKMEQLQTDGVSLGEAWQNYTRTLTATDTMKQYLNHTLQESQERRTPPRTVLKGM